MNTPAVNARSRRQLRNLSALVLVAFSAGPLRATCSSGFSIQVAGQIPDVVFTSGQPETLDFSPWYVSWTSSEFSCGLYARSTTPGVSVRRSYGCAGPCELVPPGEWANVGNAYAGSFTALDKKGDISMVFDGTTPAGTAGRLEIGIQTSDVGPLAPIVIALGNIYVEPQTPSPTWFTIVSTNANVSGDSLLLDHPHLNGNGPNQTGLTGARIFVSHVANPGGAPGGTDWNHPIGVQFDGAADRWKIRNLDSTPMPEGLGFNVRIDPSASRRCTGSIATPSLRLPEVGTYGTHWATMLVTPMGGPAHPVAVSYAFPYWYAVYADGALIPPNTCFNVKGFSFTQYIADPDLPGDLSGRSNYYEDWGTGVDFSGGANHTSGSSRFLYFSWASIAPDRPIVATHSYNPLSFSPIIDPRYLGFWYKDASDPSPPWNRWAIFHEDRSAMSSGRFNVWSPCAGGPWYPDGDSDGYGVAAVGRISCSPLPGHATATGDCDDSNAYTYPNAPEVSDLADNQCPGDPGYGIVDEISGMAGFTVAGDKSRFCWPAQGLAGSYDVARSDDPAIASCTLFVVPASTCLVDPSLPAPRNALFYLVRSRDPLIGTPGSWGQDSAGIERDPGCD